jgi:hypothetical protein
VQWISSERFAGTHRRHLSIGDGIDAEDITASYDNSVLSVTIPLAERDTPRKIAINAADAAALTARGGRASNRAGFGTRDDRWGEDMIDMEDPVVWLEDSERQAWWASVLGVDSSVCECATTDFIGQQLEVPLGDDDIYPSTTRVPASTAAA